MLILIGNLALVADIASLVGLVVSLIGFIITIQGVTTARRAAEGAREAAREAAARIGLRLLANEIGTSLQLVREVDSACRGRQWVTGTYRCDEARTRLSQLLDDPGLDGAERAFLQAATDDILLIIGEIAKLQALPVPRDLSAKTLKTLHALITALARIKGRLQSQNSED